MFRLHIYLRLPQVGDTVPEAFTNTCAPIGCREKRCVHSVKVCQRNSGRASFWGLEVFLFGYVRIALPAKGPLGNCYFCVYFVFILSLSLFFVLLFFYFSFSPHSL